MNLCEQKENQKRFKKSIVLFELIVSITIFMIVFSIVLNFYLQIQKRYSLNDTILNEILVLEATQEYLHKHLKNTAQITYENDNIYFDQILLLQSIDSFNIIQSGTLFTIQLCTNNQVCQTWKIDGQKFE